MRHRVAGLGALGHPSVDLLEVEIDHVGMGEGVVDAHLLDEAAITRHALISDNYTVERTLLGAVTGQTNLDCQWKLLQTNAPQDLP